MSARAVPAQSATTSIPACPVAATPNPATRLVYDFVTTPIGDLLLVAGDKGLVKIGFESEQPDLIIDGYASAGHVVTNDPRRLDPVREQLNSYFAGTLRQFNVTCDLDSLSPFRRRVTDVLNQVGYATVISYAELAAKAGSPRAYRAVGSVCARNPIPIIIPCHRVVRGDSLGRYAGGVEVKEFLLHLEGSVTG